MLKSALAFSKKLDFSGKRMQNFANTTGCKHKLSLKYSNLIKKESRKHFCDSSLFQCPFSFQYFFMSTYCYCHILCLDLEKLVNTDICYH